ncbi:MAG: hypothetical protein CL607_25455 [Anaerolineaceae bacterium]|nr:hypothetical protein [Anaerolineaceae bacterium]
MPKLIYLGVLRIPTEKAHGLQIMQNCEAFANTGYDVELWAARRINTPDMRQINDPFAFYGVEANFKLRRLPLLDLMPLARGNLKIERVFFYMQIVSYVLVMLVTMLFTRADVYYSRDENILFALSLIKPRHKLAYEVHTLRPSKWGRWLQVQAAKRSGAVIPLTGKLRDDLADDGITPDKMMVAHDGVRVSRFEGLPDRIQARQQIGWPEDAYIVGYMGQLKTMNMDKGVSLIVKAMTHIPDGYMAIVGGPTQAAEQLRQMWIDLGQPEDHFLYSGQVAPDDVPLYLRAFDVGMMPQPWTPHFAYYTSALKLFEYMAAGCTVVASDLPSAKEVLQHEQTALLFAHENVEALTVALLRLHDDTRLRDTLADYAYTEVMAHYTWDARAIAIRQHIETQQRLK